MVNGANALSFGLYTDVGRMVPWGSSTWAAGGAAALDFNVAGPSTTTRTIYGRIHAGQQTARPVSYLSTFTGVDATIRWGLLSGFLGCSLLTTTTSSTFLVTANVPKTCRVSAIDLDFGPVANLAANIDGASSLSATCTMDTAYWMALNGGLQSATNPTQRKMMKGSEFVIYGLYRDAARSLPWGDTNGTNTVSGTGSGLVQPYPLYGRTAPQTTPSPGLYHDTVVVTVNY
jgi:spore coat protein U-like protein